jgi:uncharacterized protein YdaU (DUF1376 family)
MSAKKKDPAFLMYSRDFLAGTMGMSTHEIGQYILLLCLQHQSGGRLSGKQLKAVAAYPTEDADAYATAYATEDAKGDADAYATAYASNDAKSRISPDVLEKFEKDESGKYFNERLEEEMIRRAQHSQKQREKAENRWKKKKEEDAYASAVAYADAYAKTMPLSTATGIEDKREGESVREGEKFTLANFTDFALRPTQWREGIWIFIQKKGGKVNGRSWGVMVDQFTSFQEASGKLHWSDEQDAKKHFFSWMNKRQSHDPQMMESSSTGSGPSMQQDWKKDLENQQAS